MTEDFNPKDYTILIVDDNPTNLEIVVDYLTKYNFRIIIARSGENALKRVEHARPSIILLDVMMPGLDGFETCRRLKANNNTKDIPIIFMTALASTEDKVKGFAAGAVDYVTKPIHQEELLARLMTHLRIRDLTQRLQKANEDKDKFFSIIAHDLRSPFQPVLMVADLLYKIPDSFRAEDVRQMGGAIYSSAKNVFDLLENLLQWSRMQLGGIEHQSSRLDLGQIVWRNVSLLKTMAADKGIILQNEVVEGIFVQADENMLDTVIRNLTANALKFTPRGGSVTIKAITSKSPTFVEVSVADTGVGISPENLQKLFKIGLYHSTTGTNHEQGTGLGLIICKEMVEKNGGQILVGSEFGKGTVAKFTVPIS